MGASGSAGRATRRALPAALAVALAAGLAAPAAANRQIDESAGTLEQAEEDAQTARSYGELIQLRLYGGSDFVIGSDFDEFRTTTYEPGGRLKLTLPVARNAAVRMVVRGSALLTDFSDVSTDLFGTPSTGTPWSDLYASSFELQGGLRPGWSGLLSDEERWTLVAEGGARARWERGASFGSAITGGGAFGVGYQIGEWLEVLVGAGASTGLLGKGIGFHPVFEVDWRFADRWRLRSRGVGAQLEYDVDDALTLFAAAQRHGRSYLTAPRSSLGGEGRLRSRSLPVSLGVRWDMSDTAEITFVAGAVVKQEIQTRNHHDDEVGHVRAGPAPFLGITLELRPDGGGRRAARRADQRVPEVSPGSTSSSTSR